MKVGSRSASGGLLAALRGAILIFTCLATVSPAAQDSTGKALKLVVPFAPGGIADTLGRALADRLNARLGQAVLVENRAGASGNLGTEYVARSVPDGQTLLIAFDGTMVINPHVYSKLGFDPVRDFAPISKLGNSTQILVAHPSLAANSLAELISRAKTLRGLSYGTSGTASPGHVSGEMLRQMTDLDLTHIPYKGGGQAVTDVVGGQIPMIFTAVATALPHIRNGRLKGLAVTAGTRSGQLPEVQTFTEAGLADFVVDTWIGVVAPAKTPPLVIERLHREIAAVIALPEVRERYGALGVEPVGNTPDQFAQQIRADFMRWEKVIRRAGIRLD